MTVTLTERVGLDDLAGSDRGWNMGAQEQTMSRMPSLVILFLLAGLKHPYAQEAGDPQAGLQLAHGVCAACHAVLDGEMNSPRSEAPSFERIAQVPGMTTTALTVALRTSHKTMPNIMLEPRELRDVTTYITSLRNHP